MTSLPAGLEPADEPLPDGLDPADEPLPEGLEAVDAPRTITNAPLLEEPAYLPGLPNEEDEQNDDAQVKAWFELAQQEQPDKALEAAELARASGASIDLVKQHIDDFRKGAALAKVDPRRWRYENADLHRLLKEKPHLAPVVMREEQVTRFLKGGALETAEAYNRKVAGDLFDGKFDFNIFDIFSTPSKNTEGEPGQVEGFVETKTETRTYTDKRELTGLEAVADVAKTELRRNLLAKKGLGLMAAELAESAGLGGDKARTAREEILREQQRIGPQALYGSGAAGQAGLKALGAVMGQVDSAGSLAAAGAVGLATRKPGAAIMTAKILGAGSSFVTETGGAYLEFRDIKDDQGRYMDREVAAAMASLYGLLAAGVEVVAMGPQLARFAPLREAIAKGQGKAWAKQMLADRTMRTVLKDLGKTIAVNAATEGAEEGVQETLNVVLGWAGSSVSAGSVQALDLGEAASRVGESVAMGAIGGAFGLSAITNTVNLTHELLAIGASQRGGARVQAIADVAKDGAVKRAPTVVAELIERETAQSGEKVSSLYVDPKRLVELARKGNAEVSTVAKELMGDGGMERLERALADSTDTPGGAATLEVPLAEYLSKWGGKPIAEQLVEDTTTRPTHQTIREQRRFFQGDVKKLAEQLAQAELDSEKRQAAGESEAAPAIEAEDTTFAMGPNERDFVDALKQQLIETGRVTHDEARQSVALHRALYRTLAKRGGKAAEAVFASAKMSVGLDPDTQRTPFASRALEKRLRKMNPQQRAQLLYRDPLTRLYNARGFKAKKADPAKPMVVHLSVEGTKWFNEVDHDTGNALYRTAGEVLAKLDPEAAKWGGDFVAEVADEAEAAALADKLHDGLLERLRELNPQAAAQIEGLEVTAGVATRGADLDSSVKAAQAENIASKEEAEASGDRAARGSMPHGIGIGKATDVVLQRDELAERELGPELLDAVKGMGDDQVFTQVFVDPLTGMLTREGFFEFLKDQPQKYVVAIDINGLKAINDHFKNTEFGDAVLRAFARVAHAVGGDAVHMAHLSGDEFALATNVPGLAQYFVDILAEAAQGSPESQQIAALGLHTKDGRVLNGLTFGYGIADSYNEADKLVAAQKDLERTAPGEEGRRRDSRNQHRRRDGLAEGGERLSRGGRAQGYPRVGQQLRQGARNRRAAAKQQRKLTELRREAIKLGDPREVAKALVKLSTPESKANAENIAWRMKMRPKPLGFRSAEDAFSQIAHRAFPDGTIPTHKEDHEYLLSRRGAGPKPGPYAADTFAKANDELQVSGTRDKVSGALEAFVRLWNSHEGSFTEKARHAVSIMQECGEGFERFELPEEMLQAEQDEKIEAEMREQELAGAPTSADQLPEDFDEDSADTTFETLTQQDPDEGTPRGFVDVAKDGLQRAFRIFLTEDSDLSTFLHESAHVYFDVLGQLAEHPQATAALKADYAMVLNWLGAKNHADFLGFNDKAREEAEEKFARGFELYLRDGKPPSTGLVESFTSFRLWLTSIYKEAAELKVSVPEPVRAVFDRLLATDDEIQRAREVAGLGRPIYRSPEEGGFKSLEEWERYQQHVKDSLSEANLRVHREMAQAEKRATEAFKTSEFKKLKTEARDEYRDRPDVRAWRYLATGEVVLEDGGVIKDKDFGRVNKGDVEKLIGLDHPLAKSLRSRMVKGGEPASNVGERFGYTSGQALLEAVAARPEEESWIQQRAEEMMRERHPEIDGSIARLDELAQKALHNAGTVDWLLTELQQLRARYVKGDQEKAASGEQRAEQEPLILPLEAIRSAAKQYVEKSPAGRITKELALQRERAAANAAAIHAAKGDFKKAYIYKQTQVMQHFIYRELGAALDVRDDFEALSAKLSQDKYRERLGQAGAAYRDVVDTLLESVGVAAPRIQDEPRQSLETLIRTMEENNDTVHFDPDVLGRLMVKPRRWRELTNAELRELLDALKNIKQSATNRNTMKLEDGRVTFDEVIDNLEDEAARSRLVKDRGPLKNLAIPAIIRSGMSTANAIDGYLLKPQTMLAWLGGEDTSSMWHRVFIRPLQEAKQKRADLFRKTVQPVLEAFENIPKGVRAHLLDDIEGRALFPDHKRDLVPEKRFELLMMALNRGNASNLERLLGGRNITSMQVDKALSLLTSEELGWVQSVIDACESLWPLVRDLEERDSGLAPPKIEALAWEVTSSDGKLVRMKGGYFPAVYDRRVSKVGARMAGDDAASIMDPTYTRPSTSRSHTNKRAESFSDTLALDPRLIQTHLVKVTHDLAFREPLRAAARLLMDQRIRDVLNHNLGDDRADVLLQWLKDVGRMEGSETNVHAGRLARIVGAVKGNLVTSTLGYAFDNFVGDLTGLLAAPIKTHLKAKRLAAGLSEYMRSPNKSRDMVLEMSGEMRFRADSAAADTRRLIRDMTASGNVGARALRWYKDHAFYLAEQIDKAVATPIWIGAFRQALDDGKAQADAVAFADNVIQQVLPSGSVVDKSAIQRDKGAIGSLIAFYGYMNVLYNMQRRIAQPALMAAPGKERYAAVGKAAGQQLALLFVTAALAELIVGRGPEQDDGEDDSERWFTWFMRKMFVGNLAPVPIIGHVAERALGGEGSTRQAPLLSVFDKATIAAFRAFTKGDDAGLDEAWDLMRAAGLVLGIPTRAVRWAEGIVDTFEGEAENPASAIVYGNRPNQPGNLLGGGGIYD